MILQVSWVCTPKSKKYDVEKFIMISTDKAVNPTYRMIELAGLTPNEDIEIKYTGLRPGEKLYEELLATKENTIPTLNEKIFRAQVREFEFDDIATVIQHLNQTAILVDKMETVRIMKGIVPEFQSKNSEYEMLDGERGYDVPFVPKS